MSESQSAQVLTSLREYNPVVAGDVYTKKKSTLPQWIEKRLPRKLKVEAVYAQWEPRTGEPRYQNMVEIGRGGYARVYRAEDTKTGRTVAVKVAEVPEVKNPTYLTPTQDHVNTVAEIEAKVMAGIYRNPRVVGVLDHFIREPEYDGDQRRAVTVMEYMDEMESPSVYSLLKRGPLSPHQLMGIADGLCEAIESIEADGIEHRDIKPENIYYDGEKVILGDLGSSNKVDDTLGIESNSPTFSPPESIGGNSVFRRIKRDHYSYGMNLYMITTGDYPFESDGNKPLPDVIESVLHDPPKKIEGNERLGKIYPQPIAAELDAFFLKVLAKKPGERYKTVAATRDAFVQIMRKLRDIET